MINRRRLFGIGAALLLSACGAAVDNTPSAEGYTDVVPTPDDSPIAATYYFVRHAEKELDKADPPLSDAGYARADALAARLKDVDFDVIYSTNLRRTRDTAAPLVEAQNVPLTFYDAGEMIDFADALMAHTGNILVVGHSNTTPVIVNMIGGEGGLPIVEATEYDRLYVVTRQNGRMITQMERYGERSPATR